MSELTPLETPDDDPGDDVLARFRFQITYAGIIALSMFDNKSGDRVTEVYCEHHEDVLIKLNNGKFIGVQVKTKDLDQGPFKTGDAVIAKCVKRFCQLDKKYPKQFKAFVIATNNSFHKSPLQHTNFNYVIELARNGDNDELLKIRSSSKTLINYTAKQLKSEGITENDVIRVISKIKLKKEIPGVKHIGESLGVRISCLPQMKSQTIGVINQVADNIILKCFLASSLAQNEELIEPYILDNTEEIEVLEKIKGKLISKELIEGLINRALEEPVSLFSKQETQITTIPEGSRVLGLKLDAGKIDHENFSLLRDQKFSAEKHFASWLYKYESRKKADLQYQQIRLIVQGECKEAYDEHFDTDISFGMNMLKDVRKRLRTRLEKDTQAFYSCKYEHLLGMAGILTEDCTAWWSEKFDITT